MTMNATTPSSPRQVRWAAEAAAMKIYLASSNRGKLRDFRGMPPLEIKLLPGFESLPPVEEDGVTFTANAVKKAEHYSRLANAMVLADDSGLEVAALDGAPGVRSARFAGRQGDDEANNRLLLERLRGIAREQRQAAFVCVLAVAEAGRLLATFAGRAEGYILDAARGTQGFGYDPLFFSPAAGCAFAELSPQEKARYSHRGAAARQLLTWVRARAC